MEFITDRTEEDALLGKTKGCYGATDLNRVEQAVSELCTLAERLGVHLVLEIKTDWGIQETFSAAGWPTEGQMKRYLKNVCTLCDSFAIQASFPDTMEKLDIHGANAIEAGLQKVYQHIQSVLQAYKYSGDFYAGEEFVL